MFLFFNRFRTFFFKLKKLIYNFYKKKKNLILFNIAVILNVKQQSSNFNEIVENDLINLVPIKKKDSFTNFEKNFDDSTKNENLFATFYAQDERSLQNCFRGYFSSDGYTREGFTEPLLDFYILKKTFNNLPKQSSPDQYVPRGSYSIKYLSLLQNKSLRADDFISGKPAPQFPSDRFLGPNPGWFGSSSQYQKTLLLADDFWSGTDFTYFFGLNSFKQTFVGSLAKIEFDSFLETKRYFSEKEKTTLEDRYEALIPHNFGFDFANSTAGRVSGSIFKNIFYHISPEIFKNNFWGPFKEIKLKNFTFKQTDGNFLNIFTFNNPLDTEIISKPFLSNFEKSPVLLDENCLIDLVGLLRYPDLVIHTWSEVYNDFFYSLYIFNLNKFEYLSRFQPVLLFLLFAIILTFILSFASRLFVEQKGQKGDAEKRSAYECGFEPFEDARNSFDVNFYLVAILFILFDLEIVFLMPWTVSRYFISSFELLGFYLFNIFLTIGFVYEWRKGALDWY